MSDPISLKRRRTLELCGWTVEDCRATKEHGLITAFVYSDGRWSVLNDSVVVMRGVDENVIWAAMDAQEVIWATAKGAPIPDHIKAKPWGETT